MNPARVYTERSRNGFSLVELLIVIFVLTILLSIATIIYSRIQESARDQRRKNDLYTISQTLEIYLQRNNRYPRTPDSGAYNLSTAAQPWISDNGSAADITPLGSTYIDQIPNDPGTNSGNPVTSATNILGYSYWSGPNGGGNCPAEGGQYYILAAGLENANDPKADSNKNYQVCFGDLIARLGSNAYVLISP